ncbi:hypothetical protein L596_010562 [Steinernema carpocapsae]|uniref:Insulin-like domain-containing protein n=1 Tax=Steinernema carpocapsae TaxID=34508 RepID=A0A4U5PJF1_STECR|nr:hypothetical protein L596_010562 [Steinernema carpocapsae]
MHFAVVLATLAFVAMMAPLEAAYSKSWANEASVDVLPKRFNQEETYYDNTPNYEPEAVLFRKYKRGDEDTLMRLCGMKLVNTVIEICNGCTKPAGMAAGKRSVMPFMVRKRSTEITAMCCKDMCTKAQIKENFCC